MNGRRFNLISIKLFISYFNFIGLALIGLSELILGKKENKNIGIVWIAMGIFVGVWLNKSLWIFALWFAFGTLFCNHSDRIKKN